MKPYIADVNAENATEYDCAQVGWDAAEGRFFFYLLHRNGHTVEHDADAIEDHLHSFEQLIAWATTVVDWDSENTRAAFQLAEADRKADLVDGDPRVKHALGLLHFPVAS